MKKLTALLLVLLLLPLVSFAETIVTSFYPIWIFTLNLTDGIDGLEVINLAEPTTGCLHDYELQNSDMVALSRADALLINGAGMESFLPVVTGAYPDLPVIDASAGIPVITNAEGEVNAHLWLDPQRAIGMATNLAEGLIRLMPQYTDQITANLAVFTERLTAVDQTLRNNPESTGHRSVIILHEAFPYFADACALEVAAVVDKEPEEDLGTSELVRLVEFIRAQNPLPLIVRSEEEDRAVSVLAAETGAPVCGLDPITTGPANPPLDYYETIMIRNFRTLQEALQ